MLDGVIKKYELEGKKAQADARIKFGLQPAGPVDLKAEGGIIDAETAQGTLAPAPASIDTTTKDTTQQDIDYFNYQNKVIEFYEHVKKANIALEYLQKNTPLLQELNRLRQENANLKDKINQLERR